MPENLIMCDSKGVIHSGRKGLTNQKMKFIRKTALRSLGEALKKASTDADTALAEIQAQLGTLLQGIPNIPATARPSLSINSIDS